MTPYRRLLVPVDLAAPDHPELTEAAGLARCSGAELHVLHVPTVMVQVNPPGCDLPGPPPADVLEPLRQELARRVRTTIDDPAIRLAVVPGVPHTEIVRYAAEFAIDLIVLAAHSVHGSTEPRALGSVTRSILDAGPCAVLVVPVRPA